MPRVPSHFELIREAALQARSGNASDIRNYISVITGGFLRPGQFKDIIDERVTDLQTRYLAGRLPPVSEEKLVAVLNRLGDQMGIPEYGKLVPLNFICFERWRFEIYRS